MRTEKQPHIKAYHRITGAVVTLQGALPLVVVLEERADAIHYSLRKPDPMKSDEASETATRTSRTDTNPERLDQSPHLGARALFAAPAHSQGSTDGGNLNLTVYQDTPRGSNPRGSITFTDGRMLIRLFEKADLSTVLHEGGHLFLVVMRTEACRQAVHRRFGTWA